MENKLACLLVVSLGKALDGMAEPSSLPVVVALYDGVVVTASASQSEDIGFISQVESYQNILKTLFTASLLGAQQNRDSLENKPASLLVVSLGKRVNEMPLSLCGRQVVGPSSLPDVVAPV